VQWRGLEFGGGNCAVLERGNELCTCSVLNVRREGAVLCSGNALFSYTAVPDSRNGHIPDKYRTVKSFMLHFLQNIPLE
jgi:hypothetical protein